MSERELTLFDKIISGEIPARVVWEDDGYMAFLTPFPNTPGFTVLIPKTFQGDYAFSLTDEQYVGLMKAAKIVANILEKAFETPRVAIMIEGTGVAYVHIKLIPLHGDLAGQTNVWSHDKEFTEEYRGWITSAEGPEMDTARLDAIQAKIKAVQ